MMDGTTRTALINAWVLWQQNAEITQLDHALGGSNDCPLCQVFFSTSCKGCPIAEDTGQMHCHGSPYDDAKAAFRAVRDERASIDLFRQNAQRFADYLRSLNTPE